MARPKQWFETKEFSAAKKHAKTTGANLYKFAIKTRTATKNGYYVGKDIPSRLKNASVEQKTI